MSSKEKMTFNKIIIDKKIENKDFNNKKEYNFFFIEEKMKKDEHQKYIAHIKKGNEQYVGVLTDNFKKDLFGYSLFKEGDEYLGEILEEKKNGFGFYNFKKENDIQDLYIGHFENNMLNGEGVYINILNKEKEKPNQKHSDYKLNIYNCYIGQFEKDKFKKGVIYIYNQNFEKLTFKNEEEQEQDNNEFSIEKHGNIILVSKSTKKNGIVCDGFIININEKDEIENKISFKEKKDSDYIYENLNNELIEKELIEKYNKYKINFKKYNEIIKKMYNAILDKIDRFKTSIEFAKGREIKKDYELFFYNNYGQILINNLIK